MLLIGIVALRTMQWLMTLLSIGVCGAIVAGQAGSRSDTELLFVLAVFAFIIASLQHWASEAEYFRRRKWTTPEPSQKDNA